MIPTTAQDIAHVTNDKSLRDIEQANRDHLRVAEAAKGILDDPFFNQVMDDLEKQTVATWENCDNPVDRDRLHVTIRVLKVIRRAFKTYTQGAETARLAIEQITEKRKNLNG